MGSVLVLRWLWERINLWSELAAIASSLVAGPLLLRTTEAEWARLAVKALLTIAAAVVAALLSTRTHVLNAFYRRVPPAGWWRQTARSRGL